MPRWLALLALAPLATMADAPSLTIAIVGGAKDVPSVASDTPRTLQNGPTGAPLTVSCSANVDCKKDKAPSVKFGSIPVPLTPDDQADPKKFTGAVPAGTGTLVVTRAGTDLASVQVTAPQAGEGDDKPGSSTSQTQSLQALVPVPPQCLAVALAGAHTTPTYDPATRIARVAVTVLGAPLTPLPESIAETDTLEVTVVGNAALLQYVTARRTTQTRTLGGVTIVGGDVTFPVTSLHAKEQKSPCSDVGVVQFALSGFAPGTGEVDIVGVTATGAEVTLGKLQIPVAALYSGMFSIGALWTDVQDPQFRIGTNGTSSFATRGEVGSWRLQYTLLYTPFIWGKRNLERPESWSTAWYKHLNPTIGIVLNDIPNNGAAGVSFDFGEAFVITYGVMVSHVTQLDPNAGIAEGAAVTGTALPTSKKWVSGQFVAISLDLRAAVQVIRIAAGSTK